MVEFIISMQHDILFRRYLGFEIHQQAAISAIIINPLLFPSDEVNS